ncbi:threonine-phosphate decarboxylase [Geobacter sulfurreducens]|uniref:threonine-phosphate decarboxylase n=1 Tax=Geobacter sulfurreducens (strain ATCC 51573 / DSM 12127 / PCA) TaxID=243231 RepID=Q748L2_GEOSL|nr:threonine-phosphate decarboxylase CobD [Geobacter sulfurreducens]AAR36381.1 L-threonine-0-3-phosphate decarboxylase [Geobacter sulfurreducens PCA]ADI85744.1 L-threonine-0-3-phosphate decarboxylase [Geobacter sulfurreducens KN400]QVW34797.1 threonine-phosphate decarboxylase [Geobacter sulfurreducens]UAC03665.1 threonine-phosphate decarboxylase CobD [Geobacter sulfurreducens]HCD95256.1 threonine-phosphate decarboxylase [Geobacter sulfurreducens]
MTSTFDHGGTVFAVARELGIRPEDLLDFSASINPLGPAPAVREAVMAAFDRLVHYPDSQAAELRDSLARHHGLPAECICAANGSTELIYLLPRLVGGGRGLVVAPPFSEYARSLTRAGWEVGYLDLAPEEGFALAPALLDQRLAEGWNLVVLANPGNPTGSLIPHDDMVAVHRLCRARGTFLVVDEAFMDFREEESVTGYVARQGGGVVLRSLTKFHAIPGLRLGFAVAAPEDAARLADLRAPWSVNTLAQAAGLATLVDGEYAARTRRLIEEERAVLAAGLAAIPGVRVYPSAANYLLAELTTGPTVPALAEALLRQRILIRDCSLFRGLNDRFFRVAVRSRADNERLLAACAAVLARTM